jgi:hypothetical protein
MNAIWKILPLTVLFFHCKQIERPTLPVKKEAISEQASPFFIVSEEKVSTRTDALNLCPVTCEEEGALWTGTWSNRSPFPDTQGGVCECRDKPVPDSTVSEVSIPPAEEPMVETIIYQMDEKEMKETFEVEATAKADATEGSKAVAKAGDSVSKAESRPDVSATVHRDEETSQVIATAKAGKAVARAKTPPSDGATTSINKQTGTVKACAQAGEARACSVSQKDPFAPY